MLGDDSQPFVSSCLPLKLVSPHPVQEREDHPVTQTLLAIWVLMLSPGLCTWSCVAPYASH